MKKRPGCSGASWRSDRYATQSHSPPANRRGGREAAGVVRLAETAASQLAGSCRHVQPPGSGSPAPIDHRFGHPRFLGTDPVPENRPTHLAIPPPGRNSGTVSFHTAARLQGLVKREPAGHPTARPRPDWRITSATYSDRTPDAGSDPRMSLNFLAIAPEMPCFLALDVHFSPQNCRHKDGAGADPKKGLGLLRSRLGS